MAESFIEVAQVELIIIDFEAILFLIVTKASFEALPVEVVEDAVLLLSVGHMPEKHAVFVLLEDVRTMQRLFLVISH